MCRITLLLIMFSLSTQVFAASGVKGGASWRGEGVPGLKVRAYNSIEELAADRAIAVSALTATDGSYSLDLQPGRYYLTARSYEAEATPGDYFCYFSGAPVQVYADRYADVGFNLIRVPQEKAAAPADFSGIRGKITFQDMPLERSYLYVYRNPQDGFKGPAYFVQPVEKGEFRLRLPPGDYWVLARKRARGGQFGPIEIGDYFSYYYGNPIRIAPGRVRDLRVEAIKRLSLFESSAAADSMSVLGRVVGPDGQPAAGLYVFAYREPGMTGSPEVFSPRTTVDGDFRLQLPAAGTWYLLARENFGGPAGDGELFGRYGGGDGKPVLLDADAPTREVLINVIPKENH